MFRNNEILKMNFKTIDGKIVLKEFRRNETYSKLEMFNLMEYKFGKPGTYNIKEDKLIITHSSVQNRFKEDIENMIIELNKTDLSEIDTIIVDIRGNTGGNSALNKPLMEFLNNSNKKLICLTDYRVFSGGRYALLDLIRLGAITIGTEISTPLNCFGNSDWIKINNHWFSSSSCFLAPNIGWGASSKEKYFAEVTNELITPVFFKPDIYIEQTKDDYINNIDTILNYALSISNQKSL